ncbi:SDR family oxidoreductase [Ectobacillus ponti]|uniref:SDR family oxidoreductase n=1 Tax=Ectobacillus ponti TaxID=2961894 RepID=A0AA42BPQ8_9BACI|nr:SDR family oxidoreductase [Ectobacillus ponti]MCP8969012.1 SDR family oxidoreductase [Ectobacillus ponti]
MQARELFNLEGKVAIVTGGGRGLGEQMAIGLAESGAHVVVCSRKLEACEEVAHTLESLGVGTLALACDITKQEDVARVVEETKRKFGHIDILINNSGISWGAPVEEYPIDRFNQVLQVNVAGLFMMTQAAGKEMLARRYGRIVNIASVAGLVGQDPRVLNAVGYSASKGAVLSLTKDLAVKWAPYGITVNALAPGFFPSRMADAIIGRAGGSITSGVPMGRLGGADDLKGAALFFASDASKYVTGQILAVDGGATAM